MQRTKEDYVSGMDIKPFHECFVDLHHAVKDKFAHLAWGSDATLTERLTVTTPLYTLIDRKPV